MQSVGNHAHFEFSLLSSSSSSVGKQVQPANDSFIRVSPLGLCRMRIHFQNDPSTYSNSRGQCLICHGDATFLE